MIAKIISGGQTGADRAALDFAIDHKMPYGGWLPKGRKTEDGTLPDKYRLQEMPTTDYAKRTEQNVMDSDGTVILSHGILTGGSALTREFARKYGKPCLHLHLDMTKTTIKEAADLLNGWVSNYRIKVVNVAGPRARKDENIYCVTREVLEAAFFGGRDNG